jgi:hypothetical protein
VQLRRGYDALEQRPDGSIISVEAGYEKPSTGATTNFVGNHMTQGAIDLVQNELTRLDPSFNLRQARLDTARGTVRLPPKLIARGGVPLLPQGDQAAETTTEGDSGGGGGDGGSGGGDDDEGGSDGEAKIIDTSTAAAAAAACDGKRAAIERYTWRDTPEKVVITVRVEDVPGRVDPSRAALRLPNPDDDHPSSDPKMFSLELPPPPPPLEEEMDEDEDEEADAATAAVAAAAAAPAAAAADFIAAANFAGAKPGYYFKKGAEGIGYYVDTNAPPPKTSDEANGDTNRGRRRVVVPDTTFVLSLRLAGEVDAERCECEYRRGDGPGKEGELRVTLVKRADSTGPWSALQAAPRAANDASRLAGGGGGGKVVAGGAGQGGHVAQQQQQQPPDLVALRRQLIAQREGRLAAQLPWFGNNGQKRLAAAEDGGAPGGGGGDCALVTSSPGGGAVQVVNAVNP